MVEKVVKETAVVEKVVEKVVTAVPEPGKTRRVVVARAKALNHGIRRRAGTPPPSGSR